MCFPCSLPLSLVVVLYVQGIGTKEWREVSMLVMSPVMPPQQWAWSNLSESISVPPEWTNTSRPDEIGLIYPIRRWSSIRRTGSFPTSLLLLSLPLPPSNHYLLFLGSLSLVYWAHCVLSCSAELSKSPSGWPGRGANINSKSTASASQHFRQNTNHTLATINSFMNLFGTKRSIWLSAIWHPLKMMHSCKFWRLV